MEETIENFPEDEQEYRVFKRKEIKKEEPDNEIDWFGSAGDW